MKDMIIAVVGIGATGSVLAAALLQKHPDTILVDPAPGMKDKLLENGIDITGTISYPSVPATHFCSKILEIKIVSTHIGLGTEEMIAEKFGRGGGCIF